MDMKSEIVFLGTMMPLHTHKLILKLTISTRPQQDQISQNLSMDGEGTHEVPALTGELLEIDDC